jgi:polysaccharide chain length determinant protein (PEP-CTERM system associated)
MVASERIPEDFVRSTVTTRIEERLQSIRQALLSRSTLERLIREFDLYREDMRLAPLEAVVAKMRTDDIDITLDRGEAIRISFEADIPETAQKVAARLASLISEENARDRQGLASDTSDFLEEELKNADGRLAAQERRLAEFRSRHAGELPDQLPSIMQAIQNRQIQLQTLNESLTRDRSDKLLLERQRADLAAATAIELSTGAAVIAANPETGPASLQLEAARNELQRLQLSRTADHPDLQNLRQRIEMLVRKVDEEEHKASSAEKPMTTAEINRINRLKELDAQISNIERQISARDVMRTKLETEMENYQSKAETVPLRESQLAALTRGHETLQQTFQSLLRKREDSQIAANLERRRAGEQFNIVDPAGLPERPYSPNRPLILLVALAAGLVLGVAFAAVLEFRDGSLRTEADVTAAVGLPVLTLVPEIRSAAEVIRARRVRVAAMVIVAVLTGGSVAAYLFVRL